MKENQKVLRGGSVPDTEQKKIYCLLKDTLRRGTTVNVPEELMGFVELHLSEWVRNAVAARVMNLGEDYIIDIDR